MKISKKQVTSKLEEVLDPELNISIVDLGLVYKVEVDNHVIPAKAGIQTTIKVKITMTLTTMGCPLISTIEEEIMQKLKEIGVEQDNIKVNLTFDPPWSIDKMTPRAKAIFGI